MIRLLLLLPTLAAAQQLPIIDLPLLPAPAQTIYLSPTGNDAQAGTLNAPKKTFAAALEAIPFGTPGVQGGANYAEVVLLEGDYYPKAGSTFVQTTDRWRQQTIPGGPYVYKNVSLRGKGNVTIHGDSLPAATQTVFLTGNGIRISNLRIVDCKLHGVYVQGSPIHPHHDLRIDSVEVDGAPGFGIFAQGYDRVLAENNRVTRSCLSNENGSTCQWPSGLRTDYCGHVTMRNNRVYRNWGEGINTSLSHHVSVTDNVVYDNYSVNIYCHSASNAIYANNLIYNQDSTFWRYCYNSGGMPAQGISIANELTCTNACLFVGTSCGTPEACCAETDEDFFIPQQVPYVQTYQLYLYNNILLNADISVWDAFSTLFNYAYLAGLHISHNTIIGATGKPDKKHSNLNFSFGTIFYTLGPVDIAANIASLDLSAANNRAFQYYAVGNPCNFSGQIPIHFSDNDWIQQPSSPGLDFQNDHINPNLPVTASPNDLGALTPGPDHPELTRKTQKAPWLTDDFFHRPRLAQTNIGAVEDITVTSGLRDAAENAPLRVFPNPLKNRLFLSESLSHCQVSICDVAGRPVWQQADFSGSEIALDALPGGVYFLWVQGRGGCRLMVVK